MRHTYTIEQSKLVHFFTANRASAPLWFIVRLYLGQLWLLAGWEKVTSADWLGPTAGAGVQKFTEFALTKTNGMHPDVTGWYAWFLQHGVLPHANLWANMVAVGEVMVGLGLIVGLFTSVAAFFGLVMNMSYLLAGTVSINPVMLLLTIPLLFAWRVAGYWGLDRFSRPWLLKRLHHGDP